MEDERILKFIRVFSSTSNLELFTECACYWFAHILYTRFSRSIEDFDCEIVYNPHITHFATRIDDNIYDITGRITQDVEDYFLWDDYKVSCFDGEYHTIVSNCVDLT